MSAIHHTIDGANAYGFQSRVNEAIDALWTFQSAANGVEWYERTPNEAHQIESIMLWIVMWLHPFYAHDPPVITGSGATRENPTESPFPDRAGLSALTKC
ncbi:hypothetical protein TNCV_1291651 [Trichonephila clavipes]|nr:hypothetical protein TNCV_1291651 [Trichonephila clavipes]